MYKKKFISCINVTYYILIILLTLLSLFYVRFESGLPTSNGEINKIIIYLSTIILLINITFNLLKIENKDIVTKNILYDIGSILFFLFGGITWIFFLIGFLYFIIPINGLIINIETLKINKPPKNEDKAIQTNNKKQQKKILLIIFIIILLLVLLFPRTKLVSREGTTEIYSFLYKITKVCKWGDPLTPDGPVSLEKSIIVEILGIRIYNSFNK